MKKNNTKLTARTVFVFRRTKVRDEKRTTETTVSSTDPTVTTSSVTSHVI
ncbi:hypothetical protein [Pedobacter psychrodurus]|nr:hypothetical protein [Pedobacter psychrodurus]